MVLMHSSIIVNEARGAHDIHDLLVMLACVNMLQASVKLYQFEQLGPDFLELASKYRDLQEDLDHANFTLQEFQKAAADGH